MDYVMFEWNMHYKSKYYYVVINNRIEKKKKNK